MNKYIYIKSFAFLLISLLVISCENEDYTTYDTSQKDGILLNVGDINDSLYYNFGFYNIDKFTFEDDLKVKLMGMPKDYDREIKIKLNNEKYADDTYKAAKAEYFSLPEKIILPANQIEANIPITINRHSNLKESAYILTIEFEDNDAFDIRGHNEFTVTFDDFEPAQPAWWATYAWGEYTNQKGILFFDFFKKARDYNQPIYDKIVERYGEFLDIAPNTRRDAPQSKYRVFFKMYVTIPLYNYSIDHPELDLQIPEPLM